MMRKFFIWWLMGVGLFSSVQTQAQSTYSGDIIDGVRVIERLDVTDQPQGLSRYYFRVTDNGLGQGFYVPVIVVKGAKPGPKLLLTAGIHGDELNGIGVLHRLATTLKPQALSGSVVMLAGLNAPGLMHSTRGFSPSGVETQDSNLNRLMPGDAASQDPAQAYAGRLWSQLIAGNVDIGLDLHTQSRGTLYPMYIFAETAKARRLAEILRPDVIAMDQGVDGTIENTLNAYGAVAVTVELGGPEVFDQVMISRAVGSILNLMVNQAMYTGLVEVKAQKTFIGNNVFNIRSQKAGFANLKVKIGDIVAEGAPLAQITGPFGDVIETLTAPQAGQVLSVATDPRTLSGSMVARMINWSDTGLCSLDGCPPRP
jgi:uncharacterized protein